MKATLFSKPIIVLERSNKTKKKTLFFAYRTNGKEGKQREEKKKKLFRSDLIFVE